MIEIGAPTLLKLGPGIIAIFVVAVMLLIAGSFAMGVKAGRIAENREISTYILKQVGYNSVEEWEAATKRSLK